MKIGSLFSGIGGLELGLEWAGVGHTAWQVESDPYCRQVLAHHWPDAGRFDDVCTVGAHNLAPVDVICGGFPCQDISYAGLGAGLQGARSGLWREFARIIREVGPAYVVVENVRALLTRGIDQVLGTLADLGYDAEWHSLSAAEVGASHRRQRIFIIAWRRELANSNRGGPERQRPRAAAVERSPRDGVGNAESERYGETGALRRDRPEEWIAGASSDLDDTHGGRCEQRDAGLGEYRESDSRYVPVGHSDSGGRRAGTELAARQSAEGRAALGVANGAGPQGHGRPDRMGDTEGREAKGRHGTKAGVCLGWSDATPVRGANGTVRLIPYEAAQEGPESPLWPVADGAPGRVARLRAIGNAVVPQCAEVVGRRLLTAHRRLTD